MPVCFNLTLKGETEPMSLSKIDELLCAHVGYKVHERSYVLGWFDIIGFSLACGRTFRDIRSKLMESWPEYHAEQAKLIAICDYLNANFMTDAWREIGSFLVSS